MSSIPSSSTSSSSTSTQSASDRIKAHRERWVVFEQRIIEFLDKFGYMITDEKKAFWRAQRARIRREYIDVKVDEEKKVSRREKKEEKKTNGAPRAPLKNADFKMAKRNNDKGKNVVQQPRKMN